MQFDRCLGRLLVEVDVVVLVVVVVRVVVDVRMIPVVVNYDRFGRMILSFPRISLTLTMGVVVDNGLVVTVPAVGAVVVVVVVDESCGFQISKTQKNGSTMGADSGPTMRSSLLHDLFADGVKKNPTTKFSTTGNAYSIQTR